MKEEVAMINTELKEKIHQKVMRLIEAYNTGILGGEFMPEDSNPNFEKSSLENYIYFTLPMALNYQRDSYKLWKSALLTYEDPDTKCVFSPKVVVSMDETVLRSNLLKYKLALQPNKHIQIWKTLCQTIHWDWAGDIRNLFQANNYDVLKIKNYILNSKKISLSLWN